MQKKISIIIACRNEDKHIVNVLESIEKGSFPLADIEVIVVDGMSEDSTIKNIKKYQNSSELTITILENTKKKTPFAFNIGIRKAKGEIIIISGARFVFSFNYFKVVENVLNDNKNIGCVGGRIIHVYENETSKIISEAMSSSFGMGFGNFRTISEDTFTDTVTPPAFRREIFNEIGYFDERLTRNQDDDFSFRLIKNGSKILLKSNISINYTVRASYDKLFKQFKQYGYWKVFVNKKHKTVTTLRQLFPVLFVLSLIMFSLLGFYNSNFIYILLFELILYLVLNFTFAIQNSKFKHLFVFKKMFACTVLHIGYGLGYLEGIIHFLLLNKEPSIKNEELSR